MNAPLAWLGLALLLTISALALGGRRSPRITPVDAEPELDGDANRHDRIDSANR